MADVQEFIDSLGNIVTVAGGVEDAMKKLAAAMLQGVTAVSSSGTNPTVDKIGELIEKEEQREDRIKKFFEKDFPDKLYDKFKKDVEGLVDEVKECKGHLATIAGRSGGGGGGGGGGGTGSCDCQAALNAINSSINTVNSTLTGSGVKLDEKAMRVLKTIAIRMHNLVAAVSSLGTIRVGGGRGRGGFGGGGGGGGGGPPSPPSAPLPDGGTPMPDASEDLAVANALLGDSTSNAQALGEALNDGGRYARNLRWNIGELEDAFGALIASEERAGKEVGALERSYRKLDWWLDSVSAHQDLSAKHKRMLNDQVRALHAMVQAVRANNATMAQLEAKQQEVLATAKKIHGRYQMWETAVGGVNAVGGMMIGTFQSYSQKVLGGLVSDLNEWERESTRMAATMTGGIHRGSAASKQLVGQYRNLLEVSNDIVEDTHQFPAAIRKQWLTAIKKGTRNLKETRDVIANAGAAAWQVGANADATADEFQKWNMNIGMSATGSASLARTMSTVSKVTGVMGENMLQAVSAAREIAQLMRDTGIYSQDVANSIVGWMASAQKFGVDRQMQNIFKASQGGLEAFNQASSETRNLLASSGQLQNVLKGDADPDKVMAGVGDAIRNAIPAHAFQKDAQGKPVGLPDLKKLSKAERSRLDLILKRRFGMKLGEATRLLESIQDQNPQEKLDQINRELKNPMLTDAEKQQLEMQKKQLQIALDEKNFAKVMDGFGQMSEEAKKQGVTFNEMLKAGKMTEATFRTGISDSARLLSEKMERQGKTFKDAMGMTKEAFEQKMKDLIPAMQRGDQDAIKQFRELQGKMQDAAKKADSSAKNDSNVLDKQESHQQIMQNTLQNSVKGIHTMIMQMNVWAFHLVAIAGGIWGLYRLWTGGRIAENIKGTFDTLKQTIGTKGSGWVHDPYVEHFVKNIDKNLVGLGKHLTKGRFGGKTVKAKRDKTGSGIGAADEQAGILGNTMGWLQEKFSGLWGSVQGGFSGMFDGQTKTIGEGFKKVFGETGAGIKEGFKNTFSKLVGGGGGAGAAGAAASALPATPEAPALAKKEATLLKKDEKKEKREEKLLKRREKGEKKESGLLKRKEKGIGKGETKVPGPKMSKPDMPKAQMKGADAIMKGAGKLLAIAAGVVLLGVILIGAAMLIMKLTGFDAKQAQEVAWVIGTVIGAGAGTLLAAAAAAKVMEWANKTIKPGNIKDIYMGGLMLMLILPAVLLVGLAIVALGALLSMVMDPKKAAEAAWAVGQIMLAAGIVAAAILLGAAAMTVLGLLYPVAQYILPLMAIGALALLLLTPVMMLMAYAVIKLAEAVMKMMKIDSKWAAEVSKNVADILMSAGIIAAAVLLGAATLWALAGMILIYPLMVAMMSLGTIALLALTPVIIGLAMAVIKMASYFSKLVDIKEAKETSAAMADILWATFKIAAMVVASTYILAALAGMIASVWILIPLMVLGTAALLALTPAVLGMALAIVYMASKFANAVNVKWAAEVAKATSDLLSSAFKIAKAVAEGKDYVSSLGAMSIFAGIFTPTLDDGAKALWKMAGSLFRLAISVITLGQHIINLMDPKKAAEVSKSVGDLLKAAFAIAKAVVDGKESAENLATMNKWSLFMAPSIDDGAAALRVLQNPFIRFISTVLQVGKTLTSGWSLKDVRSLLDIMKAMGDVISSVANMMTAMNEKIVPLTQGSWWGLGPSMADKLNAAIPVFNKYFESISDTLKYGLILPLMRKFSSGADIKKIQEVGRTMKALGDTVEGVAKVMTTLNDKIAPLVKPKTSGFLIWKKEGPSMAKELKGVVSIFSEYFGSIADSLIDGIVRPIMSGFPQSRQIQEARDRLTGVLKVLDLLPKFISDLAAKMIDLARAKYWNYNLNEKTQSFAWWFYGIGNSLGQGVVDPILNGAFPAPESIEQATGTLTAVVEALTGLAEAMSELATLMGEIAAINLDFSALEGVGGVFKSGKLQMNIVAKEEGGEHAGGFGSDTQDWMDKLLGVFTGVRAPSITGGGLLRGMRKGFSQVMDKPMTENAKATGKVGTGMNKLSGGFSKFSTSQSETPSKIDSMKNVLDADIKELTTATKEYHDAMEGGHEEASQQGQTLTSLEEQMRTFVEAATTDSTIYTHDTHSEPIMRDISVKLAEVSEGVRKVSEKLIQAPAGSAPGSPEAQKALEAQIEQRRKLLEKAAEEERKLLEKQLPDQHQVIQQRHQAQQQLIKQENQQLLQQAQQHGETIVRINGQQADRMMEIVKNRRRAIEAGLDKEQQTIQRTIEQRHAAYERAAAKEQDQALQAIETKRRRLGTKITADQEAELALMEQQINDRYDLRIMAGEQEKAALEQQLTQRRDAITQQLDAQQRTINDQINRSRVVAPGGPQGDFPQKGRDGDALVSASDALQSLEKEATSGSSLDTHDHTLEAVMIDKVLPHIENMSAVMDEAKPVVTKGDFDAQVQARVEQSRPSAQMQAATDYLAEIAVNTGTTVEELMKVNETLEEIKEQLTPKRGAGDPAPSKASKPRGTPNYYSWQFGRFGDTSAKQRVNPGV